MSEPLKLRAETADDLEVLSATLQDAIGRVGDIRFDTKAHSLTLRLTRFRHESAQAERVLCGLRFDGVLGVKASGIDRSDPENLYVMLALSFDRSGEKKDPGGTLNLIFAGGGHIKAKVEAIDAILVDAGEPRGTDKQPLHPLGS